MAFLQYLFFWNLKVPDRGDNDWHPQIGRNPIQYIDNLSSFLKRTDIDATMVDAAPFVAGVGSLAHVSQIHAFGFTAPASVFRNVKTMTAMHRTVVFLVPFILTMQAAGIQYRTFIPRWCHERELRRDEAEVRKHVDVGAYIGGSIWIARLLFKVGLRYWAPIDVVMGGALSDLLHREYVKAHNL
ncbi:hypothetical protein Slin14017_G014920 [Septoria linicola]|nr:hypothetical protein Slin14017_G014920 [Septoria linicola]